MDVRWLVRSGKAASTVHPAVDIYGIVGKKCNADCGDGAPVAVELNLHVLPLWRWSYD